MNNQHTIKSRFEEAFSSFKSTPKEELSTLIEAAIKKHFETLNAKEYIRLIHNCIDLTSLGTTDYEDHIFRFVSAVNELDETDPTIPPVASICVYPNYVKTVKEHLTAEEVKITSVAGGFPSAQTFMEVKIAEINLAVADGADEVDIVLPVGDFLAGNYDEVVSQIEEQRDACKGKVLKVILETGALKHPDSVHRASILSLFSGADFIKTSTGKDYPGATLEDTYVMASVLKQYFELYGKRRGLKISGGVRVTEDAIKHLCVVKEVLGEQWFTKDLFRIGASSLEADVLNHLR